MNIDSQDIEQIEKEHWKHAKGVKCSYTETNSALAGRDYTVPCSCTRKIGVIKG